MSMLVRAAKVSAWLGGRDDLTPEDLRAVFHEVVAHRVFFTPIYELQRGRLGREFTCGRAARGAGAVAESRA